MSQPSLVARLRAWILWWTWGPERAQLYDNAKRFYDESNRLRDVVLDLAGRRDTLTAQDWRDAIDRSLVRGTPNTIRALYYRKLGIGD